MLHIILLIIKIIGIILLVLIGLVLLVTVVILFAPFQYQGKGSCKGTLDTLKAEARVSWIFHLVSGKAILDHGSLKWQFRVAWLKWNDETAAPDMAAPDTETAAELEKKTDRRMEEEKAPTGNKVSSQKLLEDEKAAKKYPKMKAEEKEREEPQKEKKEPGAVSRLWKRIKNLWQKIKYTFQKLCVRIKVLIKRKNMVMEFLADEVHKSAFKKVKKELKRLLKKMKPKRLKAKLHFGFEDPSLTGKTLAILSMAYPFIGGHAEVIPEFEQSVLEGDVFIKGHIRILYFAATLVLVLIDKNIRKTYKDFRKIKM